MKTVKALLQAMHYDGHISIRKYGFDGKLIYIGGGTAEPMIQRYGGYKVDRITCIDNVLVIFVN